jgi:uncharacterized membrane protein/uncharacterized protein YegL
MPFSFSFDYPEALWLLLLLPVVVLMARQGGRGAIVRKRARRISIGLRLLIVTLLVLGLAGTMLVMPSHNEATVFLLDFSDSVGATGRAQATDFTRQALLNMNNEQQAGVVVFGQDALVEKLVDQNKNLGNIVAAPKSNYTNLAEAVRLGTALLPGNIPGRLVLITDGNQNIEEVRTATEVAGARGIQIDVVTLKPQASPEVSIDNVQVPNSLRNGEEFDLKVAVDSNYSGPARLQILQDGQVVSDKPVDLKNGANLFSESLTVKTEGPVKYSARIVAAQDTLKQNNESEVYSVVKSGPKILLVDGHPDEKEADNLKSALTQTGIDANVIPPDLFPAPEELRKFDSVVLVDVPGSALKPEQMQDLQSYVKDQGKGLITVGGEESYGVGGWFRTPLEELSPLELQLPSKLQTPSVAMVLVIDRSGSMASSYYKAGSTGPIKSKLELAKDAAYLAITQLSSTDQVGVVTFDTTGRWHIPLAPLGDPASLQSAIGRIALGGGTNIYSGLAPAIEALKTATAQNKHVILLTDGQDRDRNNYDALVADANKYNITISTVGLGDDVNTYLLSDLAERGGGRYTFVDDAGNLPKIFAKEAHLAARNYIVEEPFTPAISDPSPILKNIASTPQLKGYVATKAKKNTTVALVTKRNEPLLAHWQYGLGRVAAWTSDAKARWATDWLSWPDFPKFWSQMVRWTIAENKSEGLQVQATPDGNRIRVSADAFSADSQYLNGLNVTATLNGGNAADQANKINLTQTAPGHYEGYFTPPQSGSYLVNVQGSAQPGQVLTGSAAGSTSDPSQLVQTVGASAYSSEYKQLGTNDLLLKDIAFQTGGRVLTKPEQVFQGEQRTSRQPHSIWPWLLLAALLLFPLDIAARTTRMSPAVWRRAYLEHRASKRAEAQAARMAAAQEMAPETVVEVQPVAGPSGEINPAEMIRPEGGEPNSQGVSIQDLLNEIPGPGNDNLPPPQQEP